MQKEFKDFFEEVTKALNISDLPQESKDSVIGGLGEQMIEEVMVSALEVLSPEDREKFMEIQKEDDAIKLYEFLNEKIPNFGEFARERARSVVEDFLKAFGAEK